MRETRQDARNVEGRRLRKTLWVRYMCRIRSQTHEKINYMILCVEEEKLTSAMLILFFKIILVLRTLIVNTLIVRILHFELHGRTQVD